MKSFIISIPHQILKYYLCDRFKRAEHVWRGENGNKYRIVLERPEENNW
jgi:hypothetical protein